MVERVLGKDEVLGSSPISSFQYFTVFQPLGQMLKRLCRLLMNFRRNDG